MLIAVAELVAGYFRIPAWPAFMAMIFFFVEHMDVKKAPQIIGVEFATLAYILAIVYAIVAFGEMAPIFFNNDALMYLTVTGLAMHLPQPNPLLWMAVAAVGGGLLIAGVVAIGRLMARPSAPA